MGKTLFAPQIDNFIKRLDNSTFSSINSCIYDEESYKNIDELFDLLRTISPISENGCRELWFCAERGSIDDFGNYEEWLENDEVESREEFEELWRDYYPNEKEWYHFEAVEDEKTQYKAVVINHKMVIELRQPHEQGFEHNISDFTRWLCDNTKECIGRIKNKTYLDYVRRNLPCELRTGTILQSELWEIYPDDRTEFFQGLSDSDIEEFINYAEKQSKTDSRTIGRLSQMTANDFYGYCALGYRAMGYDGVDLSPRKQYYKHADGRDGGLSEIDGESPKAFDEWLCEQKFHGDHPWEVCRGGNSTHISLQIVKEADGYYLCLAGSAYGRTNETIKFYLALCRAGLPVYLSDCEVLKSRVLGTEKVGVVPQGVIPKYRHSDFPGENIISFMNLPYENTEAVASKCVWQDIREITLL